MGTTMRRRDMENVEAMLEPISKVRMKEGGKKMEYVPIKLDVETSDSKLKIVKIIE
jgi:hypothetical protein